MTLDAVSGSPPPSPPTVHWRMRKPRYLNYWYYDFDRRKWFRLKWRKAQKAEAREIN